MNDLKALECITLFVEDLASARDFYTQKLELPVIFEDPASSVVKFENVMLNLLQISESEILVTPLKVASANTGSRLMFTIRVPNVDQTCAALIQKNIKLLNGPIDRPWGRRTAAFADPAGNVWELAHEL